jgi:ribose transport system permease protein
MEFDAIAAVVLGGTSFERGEGWLFGTVMGVLTIGILRNALNLLGIESSLQVVSVGMLVLLVVVIDSVRKSRVNGAKA